MASQTNDRLRKHREAMRLVQLWVPDTRQPSFAALCREQSARLLNDPQESQMLELIEVNSDHTGWR
jgi:Protein  of unknown function (DUF3018)